MATNPEINIKLNIDEVVSSHADFLKECRDAVKRRGIAICYLTKKDVKYMLKKGYRLKPNHYVAHSKVSWGLKWYTCTKYN